MNQLNLRANLLTIGGIACLLSSGCTPSQAVDSGESTSGASSDGTPRVERVLTQEERDNMTPDGVLQMLKDGNQRFVSGTLTSRDHSKQVREATFGQFPKAVVLSCLDSRIPVEDVFDRGIGDIFVARVAGNFQNTDILGSMEFGCKVAGAKLILVLGHEHCGAIKGAIDHVKLGNITPMLKNIEPAVKFFADYEGEKTGENDEFVHMVAEQNVRMTIAGIRENSPILAEMESNGDLKIVGGIYNMATGTVALIEG
ncbi:Carbonic anhydrase [Allorhodopirellula solitaria]|uniref:Carbonic anhydrase n=2 Tax=Allorhodopirellula solitaria TaxID=2527987 RepID=A0A5C5X0D9_9BACT|nr:Carbonic anhydrase [Allorhodopirellula solitaria]